MKQHSFWQNHLTKKERYESDIVSLTDYKALVERVKVEYIKPATNLYFSAENKVIAKRLLKS